MLFLLFLSDQRGGNNHTQECMLGCVCGIPVTLTTTHSPIHPVTMSRRERPWSVYRADTQELSSEMLGLALAGIQWYPCITVV